MSRRGAMLAKAAAASERADKIAEGFPLVPPGPAQEALGVAHAVALQEMTAAFAAAEQRLFAVTPITGDTGEAVALQWVWARDEATAKATAGGRPGDLRAWPVPEEEV